MFPRKVGPRPDWTCVRIDFTGFHNTDDEDVNEFIKRNAYDAYSEELMDNGCNFYFQNEETAILFALQFAQFVCH